MRVEKPGICVHAFVPHEADARVWHPGAWRTMAGAASPGCAGKQGVQRYIHMAYVSAVAYIVVDGVFLWCEPGGAGRGHGPLSVLPGGSSLLFSSFPVELEASA